MKISLLISRAHENGPQNRGDMIDVDDDEAARMIDAGQAVAAVALDVSAGDPIDPKAAKAAVAAAVEKAIPVGKPETAAQ